MTDTSTPSDEERSRLRMVADAIRAAVTAARREVMDEEHTARHKANEKAMDKWEATLAPLMAGVFQPLLDNPNTDPGLKPLLAEAINPTHQEGFFIQLMMWMGYVFAIMPALGRPAVQTAVNDAWAGVQSMPTSPADAADMVERGVLSLTDGYSFANASGLTNAQFDNLVAITGEPPGPMDALKLWLRGDLTDAEVEQMIRYSRIRDQYITDVMKMAYSQMSPADAIELAIKEVVDTATAAQLFERGGGLAGDFQMLYQGAGNSIGAEAAMGLWNHGLIDQAEVEKILSRTRINPMFYGDAELLRHKFLGVIQIQSMIKAGTVSEADATSWLLADGYEAAQVAAFVGAHSTTGGAKAKAESESLVVAAYTEQLLTKTEAEAALLDVGYTPDVADLILSVADWKAAHAQMHTAVSAVRGAYITRRIARTAASGDLDALGVPAAARDAWLTEWDIDLSTHVKALSESQIIAAMKKSVVTPDDALSRLQKLGYSAADATVLINTAGYKVSGQ